MISPCSPSSCSAIPPVYLQSPPLYFHIAQTLVPSPPSLLMLFSNLTSLFLVSYTNLGVHTLYLGNSAKTDFPDTYRDSILPGLRFALEFVISIHVVQVQVVNSHTRRNTELGLYNLPRFNTQLAIQLSLPGQQRIKPLCNFMLFLILCCDIPFSK